MVLEYGEVVGGALSTEFRQDFPNESGGARAASSSDESGIGVENCPGDGKAGFTTEISEFRLGNWVTRVVPSTVRLVTLRDEGLNMRSEPRTGDLSGITKTDGFQANTEE
jgi:hypothetical protein